MKNLLFLLLCSIGSSVYATNSTFEKLKQVNVCWSQQRDVTGQQLPLYGDLTEREWIRTHLSLVETILRNRSTEGLTAAEQNNRAQCLDNLHGYWQAGNFPINEDYTYRTPIFIDKHDNFCAVGYLVKASGHEEISRMISAKTNLAYVHDMKYPELTGWAKENGFTTDELAWIQPGYPPQAYCGRVGNGVDGAINELFADEANSTLYVGGSFTQADGSITANSIAYVTEAGGSYTWHGMGAGVNGTVNAIVKHDNKIFVAGSFTMAGGVPADNIAYWDGSAWHSAGCVIGTVYDLAVYGGNLYAAGEFVACGALPGESFAKWNGTNWEIMTGITGRVNTMEVKGTSIVLGGAFNYGPSPINVIWWNDVLSFAPFVNNIANEVMDFELYQDTLYTVCKRTDATDTANLFLKLRSAEWFPAFETATTIESFHPTNGSLSLNTLCAQPSILNFGGQFQYSPMMGTYGNNCYNIGHDGDWVIVDSAVNKMVLFKGRLIAGGKFKNGNTGGVGGSIPVNGITYRITPSVSVPEVAQAERPMTLYPNPARAGGTVSITSTINATHYTLLDVTGRLQGAGSVGKTQQVTLPALAAGMYIMNVSNDAGDKAVQKIAVE